jgi:succinate dehydrogenase hydrophobic anchor subunit
MTGTRAGAVRSARPGAVRPRGGRSRAIGFLLVRLTGVLLAVLVLGHFALTHVINDVADTGSGFVRDRLASAVWLGWDAAMLTAAFAHGAAGLWIVVEDYTPDPVARRRRHAALVAGAIFLWAIGTAVLVPAITR